MLSRHGHRGLAEEVAGHLGGVVVAGVLEVEKPQAAVGGENRVVEAEVRRTQATVDDGQWLVHARARRRQHRLADAVPRRRDAAADQFGRLAAERRSHVDPVQPRDTAIDARCVRRDREAGLGCLGQGGGAAGFAMLVHRTKE